MGAQGFVGDLVDLLLLPVGFDWWVVTSDFCDIVRVFLLRDFG